MKRLLCIIFAALLTVTPALSEPGATRVAALKGPTAMGMVELMKAEEAGQDYTFTIAASSDIVTPMLIRGEIDIACVPANLSSILYNNTGGAFKVLAVNTLGVLYVVERGETVNSISDLKGRTIYSSGKGSTPEYALNYLLTASGLDPRSDVNVEYKSEHAECLAALLYDSSAVAVLPQPFVSVAQANAGDLRVAIDMSGEWDKLQAGNANPSGMITGVVIARADFVNERPEAVNAFLSAYARSVEFVNSNLDEAARLVGEYGIVEEAVALAAIPYCNIVCITGAEMQSKLSGYLSVLYAANADAVGGKVPDDAFYYVLP